MPSENRVMFDRSSAERIADVVRRVERQSLGGGGPPDKGNRGQMLRFLGRLQADLAYNATATVKVLEGATGSEAPPSSGAMTLEVHNLSYRQLWSGANVACEWFVVPGGSGIYRVMWSDSAARIRAVAEVALAAGASGAINTITPIDGRVGPAGAQTATNVLANYTVVMGAKIWCEWTQANNRWEVYAADCAP